MKFYMIAFFILGLNTQTFAVGAFDTSKYIESCGGKVYPDCDSKEVNQLTIYKEAETLAKKLEKKILLIMGANWCPPCNTLNNTFKNNPDLVSEIEKQFLIVELSGDIRKTRSSNDLIKHLGIFVSGYPTLIKVDPISNTTSTVLTLSYNNPEIIKKSILEAKADKRLAEEAKGIKHIGSIPIEALSVPLDLTENFGQYAYFKSKKGVFSNGETDADKYINAGLARFNLFHYIDAARAFSGALKLEPNNALAKAFLAMSISTMDQSTDTQKLSNIMLTGLNTSSLSKKKKAWFNFAKSYVYSKSGKLIQDQYNLSLQDAFEILVKSLGKNDLEVLTLATFLTKGARTPDSFESAIKIMPKNAAALHYLTHHYENSLHYGLAEVVAAKLTNLATDSAHAQHMLGHIAPRLKKWKLAETQFLKASDIHKNWTQKYNFPLEYDWHYSHNLDLMGSVYVGLGQTEKAMELFTKSCKYDHRACTAALKLGAYTGTVKNAVGALTDAHGESILENSYYKNTIIFTELESSVENLLKKTRQEQLQKLSTVYSLPNEGLQGVELLLKAIIFAYANQQPLDIEISDHISLYAKDRLGCASFDGWGKGMLDLMRLIKFSKALGFEKIEDDVNKLLKSGLGIEFSYSLSN